MVKKRAFVLFALGMSIFTSSLLRADNRKAVKIRTPQYPRLAAKMRVEGRVKLNATVEPDGSVSDVKVVSGMPLLAGAATQAIKEWKYEPANDKSTQPIEVKFTLAY